MSEVIRKLSETPADRLTPEPKPISYLRAYSNYLDPKLGATSGDTWTLIATVVRNLVLNWLILLPLLAIALLIPRIVLELIALTAPHRPYSSGVLYPVLGAAFIAGTYAVRFVTLNLPGFGNKGEDERAYLRKGLLPFVLTAVFLSAYWYLSDDHAYLLAQLLHFCLFGFAVHAFGTLLALIQVRPVWREYEVPKSKLQAIWRKMRPAKAVVASGISGAVDEALGRTTNVNEWVYLSDGGHFENLGLYEMVLRRCRTIIVIDSGADPDYKFEDLGNAVRKIRIDLGISITFEKDTMPTKGKRLPLRCR